MNKKDEYIKQLIERYLAGTATPGEAQLIRIWMAGDSDLDTWLREQVEATSPHISQEARSRIYDAIVRSDSFDDIADDSADLQELPFDLTDVPTDTESRPASQGSRSWVWWRIAAAAAVLLVGFLTGALWQTYLAKPYTLTLRAGIGEQPALLLPDGTDVRLNAMSELTYTFDRRAHQRRIILSGEAYFKAARDEHNPLCVEAQGVTVECLGTEFDVKAYPDDDAISVMLAEGRVSVAAGNFHDLLSPGTLLSIDRRNDSVTKRSITTGQYADWATGFASFSEAPLSSIAGAVRRATGCTIRFDDASLAETRFDGTLCVRDFAGTLRILSHAIDVDVRMEGDSAALLVRRPL